MVYTSFRSLCEAGAEAVKTKLESSSDVKGDDVPSNIALIPTGSGGLHLDTTLTLTSDKSKSTGPVTLTAVLQADYDTLDTDLKGYLSNATITLYDDNGSVYRSITNNQGVATFEVTITENTTFYCSFAGTADYTSSISEDVTVEKAVYLFKPELDGTTPMILQWTNEYSQANGIVVGKGMHFKEGWDNTVNWSLEFDLLHNNIRYTAIHLLVPNDNPNQWNNAILSTWEGSWGDDMSNIPSGYSYTKTPTTTYKYANWGDGQVGWLHIKVVKDSSTHFYIELDGEHRYDYTCDYLSEINNITFGTGHNSSSSFGPCTIKNVEVTPI